MILLLLIVEKNGDMLFLLDLSAAFDTIDHDNQFLYSREICMNLWDMFQIASFCKI